ncbi:MAG: copper ion binding protein [Clostridiales bacterium]|nr:copper ion binding protein [Clostridiales bacterium]
MFASKSIKSVISVDGMSCDHCVKTVKTAVGGLDGVKNVKVDLKGKSVTVSHNPELASLESIKNAITEAGYEVA